MKKNLCILLFALLSSALCAQTDSIVRPRRLAADAKRAAVAKQATDSARQTVGAMQALAEWDHEEEIKDMDLTPKIVTGGLLLSSNISNFIISNWKAEDGSLQRFSSRMRIGGEFGGFMDFYVTKHFAIQPQLLFMAEQNRFGYKVAGDLLWSFGMDIPVYFLGRWGNRDKGYLSVGAGPFTHFTFASNRDLYNHDDAHPAAVLAADADSNYDGSGSFLGYDFELHDNHSGLAAYIGYEFRFGMQIMATYKVSLTDIAYFKKENPDATFDIYPQRVSLGLGYRFK